MADSDVLALQGGPALPWPVIALALALEDRGLILVRKVDTLRVLSKDGTRPTLSEAERAAIVRWKDHLLALVDYMHQSDLTAA